MNKRKFFQLTTINREKNQSLINVRHCSSVKLRLPGAILLQYYHWGSYVFLSVSENEMNANNINKFATC